MTKTLELSDYIAVVSDFDDTILDNGTLAGTGLHERSRLDAIRAIGAERDMPALAELPAELNTVAFVNASVHSVEGAFWWLLVQRGIVRNDTPFDTQHPIIRELVAAKDVSYRHLLETDAREVPGANAFFGKLYAHGFAGKLAIASTGQRADILRFLDVHGFNEYFPPKNIIAKEDSRLPKPDPDSFRRAIESLGISVADAPQILAFEDDPRGIEAAKALGMYTCAVTTRFTAAELLARPVRPDIIAADFNEYLDIFGL
ncbi:MAG: HAD family hydrolase [Candidatus Saccharibacteria bacterium]